MAQDKFGSKTVKGIFFVLTIGVCLVAACKKNSNDNTEEELIKKVKAEIPNCICDPYINKYLWKGEIVYIKYFSGPNCDGVPFFYNSNGERLNILQQVTYDTFLAESTFIKLVWTCDKTSPEF